ncbi:MAG: hypothetical protein ACR2QE_12130 [Acidimicrobiales bacterium]
MTLLSVVLVGAAGCVYPLPAVGEPVPELIVSVAQDVGAGTVTITVEVTDLDQEWVEVWADGLDQPSLVRMTAAPWTATFPAGGLAAGSQQITVLAAGDGTVVLERVDVDLVGCNGLVGLCARRFDEVRYVTTHNAMSSAADGWIGPNHNDDVPAQLESGVRALMLDTHRAGDTNILGAIQVPGVDPDAAYLCHTICALGQQPLADGLSEIAGFLDANPDEVVILIIESYLGHDLTAAAFAESGLDQHAYVPVAGQPWPTLAAMVADGRRLVVLQDRAVDPAYPWLLNVWDHAFETHFDNSVPADFSCAPNRGSTTNPLFILNHFLTDVFGSPALAQQVNFDPLLSDRLAECEQFHDTPANFVTVDFADIGDVHAAVLALNGG